jgi:transglutaminase-like putative cysteine protease
MRASPLVCLLLSSLALFGQETGPRTFRQWLGGEEVGGTSTETRQEGGNLEIRSREWMVVSRQNQEIRQEVNETARQSVDGHLTFTWRLQLSAEPYEGRAVWSPLLPRILMIQPTNGPAVQKEVPEGAILWPGELELRLKEAAKTVHPVQAITFSFPIQQWSTLQLEPKGPAPLPGYPDAVRFTGQERQGAYNAPVEIWISPTEGEVRNRTELSGLVLITQRSKLPAPTPASAAAPGFFERTLQRLPPHPFQPWLSELTLRAVGPPPDLPEDAQQVRLSKGLWRLRRAALPTAVEASQPPVKGAPDPADTRYLAPSQLVSFQDPAFDGLIQRMALRPGLSRWELAQRVNTFVFDWITDKDYTVGFASALEVCRNPRGDCTEHSVLAVALLRRLGVPARGVTGWVGLGEVLGLHFWVEVRLKDRWIPIDPTFDQAPASALRIKLGDTDLADLGSIAWEGAANDLAGVQWVPVAEESLAIKGDQIAGSGGIQLRLPGGRWELKGGILRLRAPKGGPWRVEAVTRPSEAQLKGAEHLAGARTLRSGWWLAGSRLMWMDLGGGRWLQLEDVSEREAFDLLDQLLAAASSS